MIVYYFLQDDGRYRIRRNTWHEETYVTLPSENFKEVHYACSLLEINMVQSHELGNME